MAGSRSVIWPAGCGPAWPGCAGSPAQEQACWPTSTVTSSRAEAQHRLLLDQDNIYRRVLAEPFPGGARPAPPIASSHRPPDLLVDLCDPTAVFPAGRRPAQQAGCWYRLFPNLRSAARKPSLSPPGTGTEPHFQLRTYHRAGRSQPNEAPSTHNPPPPEPNTHIGSPSPGSPARITPKRFPAEPRRPITHMRRPRGPPPSAITQIRLPSPPFVLRN